MILQCRLSFALVFWIRALFTLLSDFWSAKLIGKERQFDE
ncbi:hypothetical protein SynTAK9802_02170 [Synechococcus sp. TAK9802]|nr:hypothetical protein SynTAK9802_02170 [Synechococcus sp. TAK9802]